MERGSGILLHISSLPSKFGIGTFGSEARKFVKFLQLAGQKYWQVLPLNPTSYGDSPYQSPSSFALNPYFIDLDILIKAKFLTRDEVNNIITKPARDFVDYEYIYSTRYKILYLAYNRIFKVEHKRILKFYKKHRSWLRDYALFNVIKDLNHGSPWMEWEKSLRDHKKDAINQIESEHNQEFYFYVTLQYLAFNQFKKLKRYANTHRIKIIGDMPIYVALDSSDVWAHRKEFLFNKTAKPTIVAGVPPDYFSPTGQLWGNPIYDYKKMEKNNFKWWSNRIKHLAKIYDVLRIDHFRGFATYYTIPFDAKDATKGKWVEGPKEKIINIIKNASPKLEIIAEDLGDIDDDVRELLKFSGFPGIKVLQFAFDSKNEDDPFLPHTYENNSVAYLGTHDNDVMDSFIKNTDKKDLLMEYLDCKDELIDNAISSLAMSNANVVIFLLQDLLKQDSNSRINTPGTASGNWTYRFKQKDLDHDRAVFLYQICCKANRY